MLTVQYARALDGILVNAADPGFTGTDFNNHRGTQTLTEGTRPAEYARPADPLWDNYSPDLGVFAVAAAGVCVHFPTWSTHYLHTDVFPTKFT